VFLGWLILSEPLTPLSLTAMAVILFGVALVQSTGWFRAPRRGDDTPASATAASPT
jgi:drug/metabolite transporter (DMT)-like permease